MGGMIAAIEAGFPQKEIADASYHYQRQVDDRTKTVVGVNGFTSEERSKPDILRIGEDVEREQLARLSSVRARRDAARLAQDLERLQQAARGSDNLIPLILQAVRGYATVGEICQALIPVFGTYREVSVL
jgi:methylmalonyl-CoA mutase N-terminal domain/subunit